MVRSGFPPYSSQFLLPAISPHGSSIHRLGAKAKGKAFYDEVSVEMLKHYAQEEGKSEAEIAAITQPKKVLNFIATGVLIEGYMEPEGGAKQGTCNHDHGDQKTRERNLHIGPSTNPSIGSATDIARD